MLPSSRESDWKLVALIIFNQCKHEARNVKTKGSNSELAPRRLGIAAANTSLRGAQLLTRILEIGNSHLWCERASLMRYQIAHLRRDISSRTFSFLFIPPPFDSRSAFLAHYTRNLSLRIFVSFRLAGIMK